MSTENPESAVNLYSQAQVVVASVVGGPLAGVWLIVQNFKEVGDLQNARKLIYIGIVITALVMTVTYFIPENYPKGWILFSYITGLYLYAKALKDMWLKDGFNVVNKHSSWKVIVISLALLGATILCGLAFYTVCWLWLRY